MPELMRWGGPDSWTWGFGWWTGPDNDLLCVMPDIDITVWAEIALSPVCSNWFLAMFCFFLKRLLVKWDLNVWTYKKEIEGGEE